jgi:hypothetical protein
MVTIIVEKVGELEQAIQQKATEMTVRLANETDLPKMCDSIKHLLETSPGDCDVFVEVLSNGAIVRMRAHPSLKVQGSSQLEASLRELGCDVHWDGYSSTPRTAVAGAN